MELSVKRNRLPGLAFPESFNEPAGLRLMAFTGSDDEPMLRPSALQAWILTGIVLPDCLAAPPPEEPPQTRR